MSRLQEYRVFIAVVESRSLTLAAERLHRSTSAVSKQLARLEADLGVQLIDRTTQSFFVTARGEQFYQQAKDILNAVDEAENSLKDSLDEPVGRLTISLPEALVETELIDHLADFTDAHPGIKVNLRISNEIEDLLENQLDFAFRVTDVNDSRLCALPLCPVNLIAVTSPRYIERYGEPRSLPSLIKEGRLIVPIGINIPRALANVAPSLSGDLSFLSISHGSDSMAATMQMARAGMGVALVVDASVRKELASGVLTRVFPSRDILKRNVYLMYRFRDYTPAPVTVFRDFVAERYRGVHPLKMVS